MIALGYLLAAVVGLSLGLLGGGGSILTVPIFVYVLGFDPKLAIVMSLPVVGVTSLAGALGHWRAGRVHARSAISFGAAAVIAAYLGARVAVHLAGALQLVLLGIVMLVAALSMLRSSLGEDVPREADTRGWRRALAPLAGAGVGLLTGVLGIGGGFLVVPALVLLVGQPMTQAVGTSLLVIAVNCVSGFAGYVGQVTVPWAFVATFTAVAVAGAIAGTLLVDRVSQRALKRAFAILILVTGVFLLANNWMKLRRGDSGHTAPAHAGAATHQHDLTADVEADMRNPAVISSVPIMKGIVGIPTPVAYATIQAPTPITACRATARSIRCNRINPRAASTISQAPSHAVDNPA